MKHLDFFVNNSCNLNCRHCYVSPAFSSFHLMPLPVLVRALGEAVDLGARTFTCSGREPLITPDRTFGAMHYLKYRKERGAPIIYGLVTNGTLLDDEKARQISDLSLDWMDVSLDGTKKEHDYIRGEGNYRRTVENLRKLPPELAKKVCISFTMNSLNYTGLPALVRNMQDLGLTRVFIGKYFPQKRRDHLNVSQRKYLSTLSDLMHSEEFFGMNIFLNPPSNIPFGRFLDTGLVDLGHLYRDEIGAVYSIQESNKNKFFVGISQAPERGREPNYMPLRINSNGDVTSCYFMQRRGDYVTFGNVAETSLKNILANVCNKTKIQEA